MYGYLRVCDNEYIDRFEGDARRLWKAVYSDMRRLSKATGSKCSFRPYKGSIGCHGSYKRVTYVPARGLMYS